MGQNRFKGLECDQCGKTGNKALRLTMSVREVYTMRPKEKHEVDDVDFWATFCSRLCMLSFIQRFYFDPSLEIVEEISDKND